MKKYRKNNKENDNKVLYLFFISMLVYIFFMLLTIMIDSILISLSTSKLFNGCVMLLTNIGGKYLVMDMPNNMEKLFESMKEYNKNSQELFASDITTFDFLKKYRKFQKGAVVEYNDLINAIDLIDKTDKFQVLYFEQTYF